MNVQQAAEYLGIAPKTLYKWKRQSIANRGYLIFGGAAVRLRFRQTGAAGQGRIQFERHWLDELKSAMEGRPKKRSQTRPTQLTHISSPLGLPPR